MTQQPGYDGLNVNSDLLKEQRGGSIRDAQRRAFNADRRRLGIPEMGSDLSETLELSPTMTYGTGVGGDKSMTMSVTWNVQGQGEMTIKVEAGEALLQVAEQARAAIKLAGTVNSNGPGWLGDSPPDAAAPPPHTGASGGW